MGLRVQSTPLDEQLIRARDRAQAGLAMYAITAAQKLQGEMRLNAPWTDRTARARQGLLGVGEKVTDSIYQIRLTHTVDYGKWLEFAHEKKYAIIIPTVRLYSADVIAGLRVVLTAMQNSNSSPR